MKKLLSAGLAVAAVAFLHGSPRALGSHNGCGTPCPAPAAGCAETVITRYRTETRTRQVPVVVQRQVCREVEVVETYTVAVPEWKPQKREVFVYKPVVKEVERKVVVALPVPPCPAPAPGCAGCGGCGTPGERLCPPELPTETRKIRIAECQDSSEKITFTEQVCTYRTEKRTRVVKKQITETVPETILKTETYTVQVPYQVKVPGCAASCCH